MILMISLKTMLSAINQLRVNMQYFDSTTMKHVMETTIVTCHTLCMNQCYAGNGSSYSYSCSGNVRTTFSYNSDDCSGSATKTSNTYSTWGDDLCLDVCYNVNMKLVILYIILHMPYQSFYLQ